MQRRWTTIAAAIGIVLVIVGVSWMTAVRAVDSKMGESQLPLNEAPANREQRQLVTLQEVVILPTYPVAATVREVDGGFVFEAPITPVEREYQLLDPPAGVRATIHGGPAGFDCGWNGLVEREGRLVAQCAIPDDVRVIPGLSGIMVLALSEPVETIGLPVSAVFGSTEVGQVIVVDDSGQSEVREVTLGATDGFTVEITDGLQEGESVYLYPVQSDFRDGRS